MKNYKVYDYVIGEILEGTKKELMKEVQYKLFEYIRYCNYKINIDYKENSCILMKEEV